MLETLLERVRDLKRLPEPEVRRFLREQAGLSYREIAEALGVSHTAVRHWERGERTPSGDHLHGYASLIEQLREEVA